MAGINLPNKVYVPTGIVEGTDGQATVNQTYSRTESAKEAVQEGFESAVGAVAIPVGLAVVAPIDAFLSILKGQKGREGHETNKDHLKTLVGGPVAGVLAGLVAGPKLLLNAAKNFLSAAAHLLNFAPKGPKEVTVGLDSDFITTLDKEKGELKHRYFKEAGSDVQMVELYFGGRPLTVKYSLVEDLVKFQMPRPQ